MTLLTYILTYHTRTKTLLAEPSPAKQEQQRLAAVDPETRISFLFVRCRRTQPSGGVDPSVLL